MKTIILTAVLFLACDAKIAEPQTQATQQEPEKVPAAQPTPDRKYSSELQVMTVVAQLCSDNTQNGPTVSRECLKQAVMCLAKVEDKEKFENIIVCTDKFFKVEP